MKTALLVSALALSALNCLNITSAGASEPPTKTDVIQLLYPISFDMPSRQEVTNMQRLVALGPQILPILADLLPEANDSLYVSRILGIASRIEGDHAPILNALPHLLHNSDNGIQHAAIRGFARWGNHDDCRYLLPLTTSTNEFVRLHALRALGTLGDANTADVLRTYIQVREETIPPENIRNDSSLKFGRLAISNIQERVDAQTPDHAQYPK